MKKLLLSGIILSFVIMSCSSQKGYVKIGKCIICGKQPLWNSIGYCSQHYTLEKEQALRGNKISHQNLPSNK